MSIENTPTPAGTGKRARTREKLLDVAAELFKARGISKVSLDQVARQAGFTKGAIYGNFAGKDELVFAVATERTGRVFVAFDGSAPVRDQLRRMVLKAFAGAAGKRRDFAFFAELDLYALSREELSRRFVEAARARHARSAEQLEPFRDELKLAPLQFVITAQAIFSGLLVQHACHPKVITKEVALVTLEALLRGD